MRKKKFSPGAVIFLVLVLLLMYLPVFIVVLYSFNTNTTRNSTEFTDFTLQ